MISSYFTAKPTKSSGDGKGGSANRKSPRRSPSSVVTSDADGDAESEPTDDQVANKRARLDAAPSEPIGNDADTLLSYLDDCDSDGDGLTWRAALDKHVSRPQFRALAKFVAKERLQKTVYPPPCDTFSALNLTPLHKVKVVIVGQDPYHGPGQGHGLSFSVRHGIKIPPSLRNMYKELLNDPTVPDFSTAPTHGHLSRWAEQGVLMLNAVLTVRKGDANSHKKKAGWEAFTDEVIRTVSRATADRGGAVFLLWGKPASLKATGAIGAGTKGNHAVIQCSHPSPLGATKTDKPFMGSRCFGRANEELVKRGLSPIDWRVDGDLPPADMREEGVSEVQEVEASGAPESTEDVYDV